MNVFDKPAIVKKIVCLCLFVCACVYAEIPLRYYKCGLMYAKQSEIASELLKLKIFLI